MGYKRNLFVIGPSGVGKTTMVETLKRDHAVAFDCDNIGRRNDKDEWIYQIWRLDNIKWMRDHVIFFGACNNLDELYKSQKFVMVAIYTHPEQIGIQGPERDIEQKRFDYHKGERRTKDWYTQEAEKFYRYVRDRNIEMASWDEILDLCMNISTIFGNWRF